MSWIQEAKKIINQKREQELSLAQQSEKLYRADRERVLGQIKIAQDWWRFLEIDKLLNNILSLEITKATHVNSLIYGFKNTDNSKAELFDVSPYNIDMAYYEERIKLGTNFISLECGLNHTETEYSNVGWHDSWTTNVKDFTLKLNVNDIEANGKIIGVLSSFKSPQHLERAVEPFFEEQIKKLRSL